MWITVDLLDNTGAPAIGLSPVPTIRIRDLSDNSLVVTDADMEDVGDGTWKYDFSAYDDSKDYTWRTDMGSDYSNRYAYGKSFQDLKSSIDVIRAIADGDWDLANPNRLTIYESGGYPAGNKILELDCFDDAGLPTVTNIRRCTLA
jgi:hypothetical protein